MQDMFTVLERLAAVAGCLASIIGACVLCFKPLRDKLFKLGDITAGMRCVLRNDMLRTYYQYHENDALRQYEMESYHKSYRAYKALGGNSFIDDLYKEVRTWEVND